MCINTRLVMFRSLSHVNIFFYFFLCSVFCHLLPYNFSPNSNPLNLINLGNLGLYSFSLSWILWTASALTSTICPINLSLLCQNLSLLSSVKPEPTLVLIFYHHLHPHKSKHPIYQHFCQFLLLLL